jgi:hypothetical protein
MYPKITGVAFKNCDFFGFFDKIARSIVFEGCDFDFCDFGLSTWKRAKFTNCNFRHTSLTQSTFIECEFRGCSWEHTGLSGNETRLERTLVDNPHSLVASAFIRLDEEVLLSKKKSRDQQIVRFWETKAVVARQLYNDLKFVGDEDSFYKACRTFITSTSRYKFERIWRPVKRKDGVKRRVNPLLLVASLSEIALIRLVAEINNWGESIIRPLFLLILCFMLFAFAYYFSAGTTFLHAASKSFEITSVAGYTRGANPLAGHAERLVEWANLAIAIFIYTVLFSTIIAKICRVR